VRYKKGGAFYYEDVRLQEATDVIYLMSYNFRDDGEYIVAIIPKKNLLYIEEAVPPREPSNLFEKIFW
jgi:hypothetical protein